MKYTDIAKFKGECKSAIQQWGEEKIDALFPGKPQMRVMAKRGFDNLLTRYDQRMNTAIDTALLFVGDKNGTIDSDTAIDMLVSLFQEMDVHKYSAWGIDMCVGKGAITIDLPHQPMIALFVGNLGQIKFTAEDLLELKDMFI